MASSLEVNVGQVNVHEIQFLENNKKIFTFFKYTGMYLVKQYGKQVRLSFGRLIISEMLWMLWHLIGIVLAVIVWKSSDDYKDEESNNTLWYLEIFKVLMFYLFVGPIQAKILRRTMEAFPAILKLIKDLEDLDFESKVKSRYKRIKASKIILRKRDEYEAQQERDQLDEMEQTTERSENESAESERSESERTFSRSVSEITFTISTKAAKKAYTIISKLWIIIIVLLGIIAFLIVCYNAVEKDELKDEGQLVLMCFCIIFPVITTWFCLVLIEHHRNMYKVLLRLKNEAFICTETNILKDIGTYINTLQALFENISDNIFAFTLGMNFAIFTIISTVSTYEILQELHSFKKEDSKSKSFEDIVYVFPLAISILHIYLVCKRTHDLKHGGYDYLKIRIRAMLPDLITADDKDKEKIFKKVETIYKNIKDGPPQGYDYLKIRIRAMLPDLITADDKDKEKIFKKVETIYKNIKDGPPQVCVYGGFQINYRILVAMCFFCFAYANNFDKINKPGYKKDD